MFSASSRNFDLNGNPRTARAKQNSAITVDGCANSRYVIRVVHDADGSIIDLSVGTTVRSNLLFDVLDGELAQIEPLDDDGDIPF